jgi:Tfp pilus assembly protein PilZ
MKKILDFIIIFLLVFLILNLFNNDKKQQIVANSVIFKTIKNSYTVPAGIKLNIENKTNT